MTAKAAILLALLVAMLQMAGPAAAQDTPKAFACHFTRGTSQAYAKGRYRPRRAQPLKMEIGGIDLERQSAELVTPDGRGTLRIVRAVGANHFLEVVAEGYLNMTTVYQKDEKRGTYPAVHSRHFGLFGEPLVAQYTGSCMAN